MKENGVNLCQPSSITSWEQNLAQKSGRWRTVPSQSLSVKYFLCCFRPGEFRYCKKFRVLRYSWGYTSATEFSKKSYTNKARMNSKTNSYNCGSALQLWYTKAEQRLWQFCSSPLSSSNHWYYSSPFTSSLTYSHFIFPPSQTPWIT